ncbi:hypothetical protein PoB_005203600 [Plakobranchus ocellatus]|uniref:Uncharacterized protein n=1 Tax=Plakobranchus ocellatus TaxID=259542 RepID=A0AAV4C2C4_9GAST|nr:hypothetical protein PoB_005203600 [Plakobranchus ocellatus]
MNKNLRPEISAKQLGFVPDKGTRDNGGWWRFAAECAKKASGKVIMSRGFTRTGPMGRESECMGVRACPAFFSDELDKTVLSLITAQVVPLTFCLLVSGRCKGTWLDELQLRSASSRRPRPSK